MGCGNTKQGKVQVIEPSKSTTSSTNNRNTQTSAQKPAEKPAEIKPAVPEDKVVQTPAAPTQVTPAVNTTSAKPPVCI